MKNADIARVQEISTRRVRQLYSQYRKSGTVPRLKKPGRPKAPDVTENERAIIKDAYERFRLCACYLERALSSNGIRINHNRIRKVLRKEGLVSDERAPQAEKEEVDPIREGALELIMAYGLAQDQG